MKTIERALSICFVLAATCQASTLGVATGFNLFTLSNDNQIGADVIGKVAIGGSFSGSTTFASGSGDPAGIYDLIVGKNLTLSNNTVGGGDVFVGGNASFTNTTIPHNLNVDGSLTISGGSAPGGTVTYGTTDNIPNYMTATKKMTTAPIDFSAAATSLDSLSTSLASLTPTTMATISGSNAITITLAKGTNVVDLTAAALQNASSVTVNAPGAAANNATLIVNVSGTNDTFAGVSYNMNGIDADHILYNFASATTLASSTSGINGTILAPFANYTGTGGDVNGQVIVNTLGGTVELHNYLFTGSLPDGTSTPEPSSALLIVSGVMMAGGVREIRKRQQRA